MMQRVGSASRSSPAVLVVLCHTVRIMSDRNEKLLYRPQLILSFTHLSFMPLFVRSQIVYRPDEFTCFVAFHAVNLDCFSLLLLVFLAKKYNKVPVKHFACFFVYAALESLTSEASCS